MNTIPDDPAYPYVRPRGPDSDVKRGLTNREDFAKAAMQGLCANSEFIKEAKVLGHENPILMGKIIASLAVHFADQLADRLNAD